MKTDIIIVGSGVSGLYCALNLPEDKQICMITKDKARRSDSYLAQGGICVLRDDNDYDSFFEDTMRAGHYENNETSVEIMINGSRDVINDLVSYGVEFSNEDGEFVYTREGAHSKPRILYHEDETGKEITSHLLEQVRLRPNVTVLEYHTVVDILTENGECVGVVCQNPEGAFFSVLADYTVLATGGIGGLYAHSTNYRHLTGDSLAIAIKHGVRLKNIDYIQIHPTTLYSEEKGREFLISESVRGEGAVLLNAKGERFVNELLPRDKVAEAIYAQMEADGKPYVWLSMEAIDEAEIKSHFPNIYEHCLQQGYDVTKEPIPVVPSQHYFMGGIWVDSNSKTSMERLYAIGETSCNGVHGKNRLASNSLLESLVFAKRSAMHMTENYKAATGTCPAFSEKDYENYAKHYKQLILNEIKKEKERNE